MKGYPLDVEEGVKMLELASEQHDAQALRFLGHTLYEGKLVPRDVQRGLSLTHEAADLGNVESRLYLGKLYVLGDGHTRDIPKAIHCYTLAYGYRHDNHAQAGAALQLGLYHFNNHGEYGKQLKMWEYYGEVLPILMQCKKQDSGDCYSSMLLSKHYLSVAAKKGLIQAYFPLALVLMDLCHVQYHGHIDAPGHSAIPESMYLARKAVDSGESQATRWISSMQAFWSSSCSHCKATTGKDSAKLMCCVRCKSIWFCSKECQVANWKEGHKFDCGRAKRLDETFANEMIEHFVTNQLISLSTTRL
jgi:TPR repeat protein